MEIRKKKPNRRTVALRLQIERRRAAEKWFATPPPEAIRSSSSGVVFNIIISRYFRLLRRALATGSHLQKQCEPVAVFGGNEKIPSVSAAFTITPSSCSFPTRSSFVFIAIIIFPYTKLIIPRNYTPNIIIYFTRSRM